MLAGDANTRLDTVVFQDIFVMGQHGLHLILKLWIRQFPAGIQIVLNLCREPRAPIGAASYQTSISTRLCEGSLCVFDVVNVAIAKNGKTYASLTLRMYSQSACPL